MSSNKAPSQPPTLKRPRAKRAYTLGLARKQRIGLTKEELLAPAEARACEYLWKKGLKADVATRYFQYLVDVEMWVEFDRDPASRPNHPHNQSAIDTAAPSEKYAAYCQQRTLEELKATAEAAERNAGVDDGRYAAESPRNRLRPSGDVYRANDQQASQDQDVIMPESNNHSQPMISATAQRRAEAVAHAIAALPHKSRIAIVENAGSHVCESLWQAGYKDDVTGAYFKFLVDLDIWLMADGTDEGFHWRYDGAETSSHSNSAKYSKFFQSRTSKERQKVDQGARDANQPQQQDVIMSAPDKNSQPTIPAKMPPAPSNNIGLGPPEQGDSKSVRRKKVMRLANQKMPTVSDEAILRLANKRVCRDLWANGFGIDVTGAYYNYLLDVDIWLHAGGKREDFRTQFIDPMFDSDCASAKYKKYVNSRPLKERKKKEKEWKKNEKERNKMEEARRKNEALWKKYEQTTHSAHESGTAESLLPALAGEDPEAEDEDWESDQAEDGSMDEEDSEENDEEIVQPQDVVMADAVITPGRLAQPTIPEILAIEEEVQHHVGMPGYNYNTMLAALKAFAEDNPNGLRLSKQDIFLQSVKAWQRMYGEEGEAAVVLNAVIDAMVMTMGLRE